MRTARIAALVVCVLGAEAFGEAVSLQPRWVVGETVRYELETRSLEGSPGEKPNTVVVARGKTLGVTLALTPVSIDGRSVNFDVEIERICGELSLPGMKEQFDSSDGAGRGGLISRAYTPFVGAVFTMTLDGDSPPASLFAEQWPSGGQGLPELGESQIADLMLNGFEVLWAPKPWGGLVEIGDEWARDHDLEVSSMRFGGELVQRLERIHDGRAVISLRGAEGFGFIGSPYFFKDDDGAEVEGDWSVSVTGTTEIDTATGFVTRLKSSMRSSRALLGDEPTEDAFIVVYSEGAELLDQEQDGP